MKIIKRFIFWLILWCAQFLTICLLGWHLLAQIDFAYPMGYQILHLERNIAEFAPKNYYRHGFEHTTPQEHWDLFSSICYSIQHGGKNLADIVYVTPSGTVVPLMHQAEITHLQDVSNLVDFFYKVGLLAAIVWLIFFCDSIQVAAQLAFPAESFCVFCGLRCTDGWSCFFYGAY